MNKAYRILAAQMELEPGLVETVRRAAEYVLLNWNMRLLKARKEDDDFRETLIASIHYSSPVQVNSSEVAGPFWCLFYRSSYLWSFS